MIRNACLLLLLVWAVYGGRKGGNPYCHITGCYELHVGCANAHLNQSYGRNCSSAVEVAAKDSFKNVILEAHNKLRNEFAAGYNDLPPASRMGEVQWNNALANLARLNVRTCQPAYDVCVTTKKFLYVGQNLRVELLEDGNSIKSIVATAIKRWEKQARHLIPLYVHQYPRGDAAKQIHAITNMIDDKANHIGCAVVTYRKENDQGQVHQLLYLVCNYASATLVGDPIYRIGSPASECKNNASEAYPNLCNVAEEYNYRKS